jgi:hypothetical protein
MNMRESKHTKYNGNFVNSKEAPEGYYALSKSEIPERKASRSHENFCNFCDWRKYCCDNNINLSTNNQRCMSTPVYIADTGKTIKRSDGCSVVFKRIIQ